MADATKVAVAIDGKVLVGPTTSTAPTGTGGTTTGFVDMGYLSEDSCTIKIDNKTEDIKAWQKAATVRKIVSESGVTIEFTMIESTKGVLELYWGGTAVASTADGSIQMVPSATGGQKALIIDIVDGANLMRFYFHHAEVTERKEIKGSNKDALGWGVTMAAYPDANGSVGTFWSTTLKTGA